MQAGYFCLPRSTDACSHTWGHVHTQPLATIVLTQNTLKSLLDLKCQRQRYKGIMPANNLAICSSPLPSNCGRDPRQFLECQHHGIHTTKNQHFNSPHYFSAPPLLQAMSYLSTTVWFVFVTTAVPEVALDRSVNLESNAFIGSILDGVVNTEEDDAGGAVEAEVAFTLSVKQTGK